jgi:Domain of unknown function (DUF1802)
MAPSFSITTALCLSEEDTIALISGRSIAALSRAFVNGVRHFAICSTGDSPKVEAWAELISSKMYTDPDKAEALAWSTIWSREYLHDRIQDRKRIFLNILKIYHLGSSVTIEGNISQDKIGAFIKLPKSLSTQLDQPVLNESTFSRRKINLERLTPPEHPELEELQSTIDRYAQVNPKASDFNTELRIFLGWSDSEEPTLVSTENDWIQKIKTYGYREDETPNNQKSNYQAGTDFEIIIRQSLEFLGFTVDEAHTGGAGGIDVFCSHPYSLVGECKSGKKIPDNTVEQLDRIAKRHLKEQYETASRFIIGPGKPSPQLLESAKLPTTSIMSPETLQKLVEFHQKYPINLLEFRDKCLVAGQVDDKVNSFLEEMTTRIKIRSHIIKSVKALKDSGDDFVSASMVRIHFNTAFASNLGKLEKPEQAHTLLIELSSPLAGYLGRKQCPDRDWKADRFYFLRDLIV